MQMNPLVKKDVKVQSRSMRMSWGLFAYEAIMALVFFFAMMMIKQQSYWSEANIYSQIVMLYPVLAVTQIIIIGVTVPISTSSSISGEKERQTFDIMMTTSMTPFSIVWGKVMTAIIQNMFYVAAGMPVMALAFVIGGLSPVYLLWFLLIALLAAFFAASIGVLCSSSCKKSISATIMSYVFYLGFFILTAVPYWIAEMYMNDFAGHVFFWLLLLNPAVYLMEFFTWTMGGTSVIYDIISITSAGIKMSEEAAHNLWMAGAGILLVLVSFLFLWTAAKRITPIPKKKAKKLARNSTGVQ